MISTREFQEKDLDSIKDIHFFMWLQLQWQKDFHKEDTIVAVDEDGSVIGVAALSYGGTWYYIERNVTHIPEYYMQFECHVQENHPQFKLVKHLLIDALKKHFTTYKVKYPDKKTIMRCWCEDSSLEEMEDDNKVVSSVTVWGIGDGRSATENIFTIPDYRHKNIARETIAASLRYLKELGETQATLSVVGENIPALSLYLGVGYHLFYNLFEMHYTP